MVKQHTIAEQQDTSHVASREVRERPAKSYEANHSDAPNVVHLVKVANEFYKVLEECLDDPKIETVHRVRTSSRRVQAMIEVIIRQAGPGKRFLEEPTKAWLRQLKRIRRAAGPVRDLDVQRKLLEETLHPAGKSGNEQPANDRNVAEAGAGAGEPAPHGHRLNKQVHRLNSWLSEQREERARTLHKQIRKRQAKLQERQAAFLAAAGRVHRGVRTHSPAAIVALEDFVRNVDSMPSLDAANLHEFRKLTKRARYVAESGGNDENAQSVAKALKRVQDSIGDWHDWLCLAEEAKTELKDDEAELTAWLEVQTEHSLRGALKTTETVRARLIGEWLAIKGKHRAHGRFRRRPPRPVAPEPLKEGPRNSAPGAA